jgi:hypothetical protein
VLAYYPSLTAYLEDLHRKEIRLHCVTVKVPGQKPTGLASVVDDTAASLASLSTSSSSSSCSHVSSSGALSPRSVVNSTTTGSHVVCAGGPVLAEFQIVSVNGRTWTFACESPADRDSWLQVRIKSLFSSSIFSCFSLLYFKVPLFVFCIYVCIHFYSFHLERFLEDAIFDVA